MRKLFAAMAIMVASTTWGTNVPTLKIGDPAPPLNVLKWLKGTPVERFQAGRIYVVEFWATWCAPCIQQMPHLSELAKKYADHVSVIGISVRETDKSSSVAINDVQRFVDRKGERMAYIIGMDDPKTNAVFSAWVEAAGLYSIPISFVIDQAGKIAWVGYPDDLDKTLASALNGRIDSTTAEKQLAQRAESTARVKPLHSAIKRKDWNTAWIEAQKGMALDPQYEAAEFWSIAIARLHVNPDDGMAYVRLKSQDDAFLRAQGFTGSRAGESLMDNFAMMAAGQDDLPSSIYRDAVNRMEAVLESGKKGYHWWAALAQARAHLDDFDAAVAAQEKAIAELQPLPEKNRDVLEALLELMQEKLASYKASQSRL